MPWASGGDDRYPRALDVPVDESRAAKRATGAPAGAGLTVQEAGEGYIGATVVEDGVGDRVEEEGFFVRAAAFGLGGVDTGGGDGVSGVGELVGEGEADIDLIVEYGVARFETAEE